MVHEQDIHLRCFSTHTHTAHVTCEKLGTTKQSSEYFNTCLRLSLYIVALSLPEHFALILSSNKRFCTTNLAKNVFVL